MKFANLFTKKTLFAVAQGKDTVVPTDHGGGMPQHFLWEAISIEMCFKRSRLFQEREHCLEGSNGSQNLVEFRCAEKSADWCSPGCECVFITSPEEMWALGSQLLREVPRNMFLM